MGWILPLLPIRFRKAEQFEVRVKKQWVYRRAHTACPAFWSRLSDLCTSLLCLSPPYPKCQCTSVQSCQNCLFCYFLPTVWACIQENQKWATGKKASILKGWFWSQMVLFPQRSNTVELTMNSLAVPFFPGKKKKQQHNSTTNLNTSEWLFPAVQLCYWFKKTHTKPISNSYSTSILL